MSGSSIWMEEELMKIPRLSFWKRLSQKLKRKQHPTKEEPKCIRLPKTFYLKKINSFFWKETEKLNNARFEFEASPVVTQIAQRRRNYYHAIQDSIQRRKAYYQKKGSEQ